MGQIPSESPQSLGISEKSAPADKYDMVERFRPAVPTTQPDHQAAYLFRSSSRSASLLFGQAGLCKPASCNTYRSKLPLRIDSICLTVYRPPSSSEDIWLMLRATSEACVMFPHMRGWPSMNLGKSTGLQIYSSTHWFMPVNVNTLDAMNLKKSGIFSCYKTLPKDAHTASGSTTSSLTGKD